VKGRKRAVILEKSGREGSVGPGNPANEEKTVRDEDWFFIFLIFSSWFSGGRDDDGDVVGMMMGRW
jgi:hypothetical protein